LAILLMRSTGSNPVVTSHLFGPRREVDVQAKAERVVEWPQEVPRQLETLERTLTNPGWQSTTVISGNVAEEIVGS
jgi:hypothetical protein